MNEAHWHAIQAEISVLRILLFALASTHPNPAALRAAYFDHKEIFETAVLHSQLPEPALEMRRQATERLEQAVFGGTIEPRPR